MDVCEHLAAVGKLGATGEKLGAAGEGTPLHYSDLDIAATPLVHESLAWLIHIDGAGAGEGGAVIIHDIELAHSFDFENRSDRVERPVCCRAADAVGVAEIGAGGVFAAVDEVVVLGAGVGGGADDSVALTEGIDRHRVLVLGFRGCFREKGARR